ncbi:MAG: aminotransferase class I/II-fold pyridoxal phosphate-dependent enzyme, partial [Bauldia sp.]
AAIAAGVAALSDRAHRDRAAAHNDRWLPEVAARIDKLGLKVTPSVGNFVLIHFADTPGRRASDADAFLVKRGVVLRRLEPYGLPNALRMTIGTAEANQATIAALADFLGGRTAVL